MAVTVAAFAFLHTPGRSSYKGGVVDIVGIVFAIVGLAVAAFAYYTHPVLQAIGDPQHAWVASQTRITALVDFGLPAVKSFASTKPTASAWCCYNRKVMALP